MTPEESIKAAVRAACPNCGHWPYTKSAEIYAGWRVAGHETQYAGGRAVRMTVSYDVVLCYLRGTESATDLAAERSRFALRKALTDQNWKILDCGPESYIEATQTFCWPMTVEKAFALDENGQPEELRHYD